MGSGGGETPAGAAQRSWRMRTPKCFVFFVAAISWPVLGAGCSAPPRPAVAQLLLHGTGCNLTQLLIGPMECPPADCGNNSAVTNAFPFNGLHPDGCFNEDHDGLAPFSLSRDYSACDPASGDPLYLDFASAADADAGAKLIGHELVAKDRDGRIRCKGKELVGATFVMIGESSKQIPLRISQMGTIATPAAAPAPRPLPESISAFPAPGTAQAPAASARRAVYLITPADQPARSLCTSSLPAGKPGRPTPILLNQRGDLAEIDDSELAGYALVVPGAVFSRAAGLIPESLVPATSEIKGSSHRWFNLACATDGLAQTELSGLAAAPIVDEATAKQRLPALHMFTAKYCKGISGTTRGTPIAWYQNGPALRRSQAQRDAGARDVGPVEAKWGPEGATCLAHARLWMSNKTIALPSQLLDVQAFNDPEHPMHYPMSEDEFLTRLCPDRIPDCGDLDAPGALVSYTMDHVDG